MSSSILFTVFLYLLTLAIFVVAAHTVTGRIFQDRSLYEIAENGSIVSHVFRTLFGNAVLARQITLILVLPIFTGGYTAFMANYSWLFIAEFAVSTWLIGSVGYGVYYFKNQKDHGDCRIFRNGGQPD